MLSPRFANPASWLRFLYNHNPLYVISAGLVLLGLHVSFTDATDPSQGGMMMAIFCGYAVLLAMASYVIIRFGQVWEDARTVLLIIVLLFVSLSNAFDGLVIQHPLLGGVYLAVGLAFAIGLSETVVAALRMRLAACYRVPFYLQLGLLFVYPLVLGSLMAAERKTPMNWLVLVFPVAVSLTLLALLPAARQAGNKDAPNGTPWRWPLYPWTLFVFTGVGMTLRSYSLSMSFEAAPGLGTGFQLYFLVPILLAVIALVLEMAIARGNRRWQRLAMLAPVALLLIAWPGAAQTEIQQRFLDMVAGAFGGPVQLTVFAVIAFYVVGLLRRLPYAEAGFAAAMILAAVVDAQTVNLATLVAPRLTPILLLIGYEFVFGIMARSSWRLLAAGTAGTLALVHCGSGTGLGDDVGFCALHALYALVMTMGMEFDDRLARFVRKWGADLTVAISLGAAVVYPLAFPTVPLVEQLAGISVFLVFGLFCWLKYKTVRHLGTILACSASLVVVVCVHAFLYLDRSASLKGLDYLTAGLVVLTVALAISLTKGGIVPRMRGLLNHVNLVVHQTHSESGRAEERKSGMME